MSISIRVREAVYPQDFAPIAAVITAERDGWPVSAEELAAVHAARDPRFFQLELVAEVEGEMVGVGSVGHIPYIHREGRFGLDLRVHPDRQGQGIGKALYEALMDRLAAQHPQELITEVWEALPRPKRFVEERGFRPTWRRTDAKLEVRGMDLAPFRGLEARLTALGIEFITYADTADDPARERKLHALDWALLQDLPYGETQTMVPLEQFIKETIQAPNFLPEACFIARQGEEWIGYSNLLQGEGFFTIQMTGVLAGWRNRGVATWLKVRGIAYAQAHGNLELRTTNDLGNAPMLAINQRLGFQEVGAMIRYKKTL